MTDLAGLPNPALLRPAASADLLGRLDQASARASFLSGVTRRLSGALHPDRAMDLVLEQATLTAVDWAQIVMIDQRSLRTRAMLADEGVQAVEVTARAVEPRSVLGRVLSTGVSDRSFVPDAGADGPELVSIVPGQAVRESLARICPVDVLTLPLSARGTTYGALSLARRSGDGFDDDAVAFLEDLSARVSVALDTTRVLAESRRVATVLGHDLKPPTLPMLPGVELASYYRVGLAEEALGGDFYDLHGPEDDWTAVVGDVCGKGAVAAVLTGRIRQSVRTAALVDRDPGRVLHLVNRTMLADLNDDTFVTAVCVRGRPHAHGLALDVAAAGHPEPLVVRNDGSVDPVPAHGTVIGLTASARFETTTVELRPGETCVLFTDGVIEAPGYRDRFGDDRLRDVLAAVGPTQVTAVVEAVAVALSAHLGDRAHDDIAIFAIRAAV